MIQVKPPFPVVIVSTWDPAAAVGVEPDAAYRAVSVRTRPPLTLNDPSWATPFDEHPPQSTESQPTSHEHYGSTCKHQQGHRDQTPLGERGNRTWLGIVVPGADIATVRDAIIIRVDVVVEAGADVVAI